MPVNFLCLSLAIPQLKLLSHVSSLRLPSGHSGPVFTLSNAARSFPFSPHLLVADASVWGTFLLRVAFRHVICGFYLFFSPVRLPSEFKNFPQTRSERVSWCLETSSIMTPFLGWVSPGVVLCSLLRVQMFFQLICRGKSCLTALFLCHLSSSSHLVYKEVGTYLFVTELLIQN